MTDPQDRKKTASDGQGGRPDGQPGQQDQHPPQGPAIRGPEDIPEAARLIYFGGTFGRGGVWIDGRPVDTGPLDDID